MSSKDRVRWAVAAAIILAVVGWLGYKVATATTVYGFRLTYATMPADDEALAAWLRAQPGVTGASVTREGGTLVIGFTQSFLRGGLAPDVFGEATRLGYDGLSSSTLTIHGGLRLW
jgi:hypothetical protein